VKRSILAAALVSAGLFVSTIHASNGYFAYGYGTKNKGMAGAGVALPQDAMAAAVNPAGTVHVGERIDAGVSLFSPPREYTQKTTSALAGGPPLPIGSDPVDYSGTVASEEDLFFVPHFGYVAPIDEVSAWGIALYGNGGMNTTFKAADTTGGAGTFGAGDTGVDLAQMFVNANYARKLNSELSVGASAIVAIQRFKAKGLLSLGGLVADGDDDDLSNNGYDYSYGAGAQFGALWQPSRQWSFGAALQSRIYMTEFDNYSDLFAEQGDFDIPANATIGLAFSPRDDLTFVADVQRIWYSDIAALGNAMSENVFACFGGDLNACLGADGGAGFGWEDSTVVKLGVQWDVEPDLTLRAGYSHANNPVPTSGVLFNVLAPAVVQDHFTLGLTKRLGKDNEFSLSAMYAPENDMDCGCTLPLTGGPESINIAMEQWEVEASYAWRF